MFIKTIVKVIEQLELILLRLPKKTKIKLRTWVTLKAILANKKTIILISILKNQKTNSDLRKLYIKNREKGAIWTSILYSISHNI